MHYSLLQLPLSQEEGPCASGTTACTTCNGWILRRRLNTVCYVGVRLLGLPNASDMLHRCVCCVFLNYLRHVRLVQNMFTVVCNEFCHATACVMCVSLPLYYDVIPMIDIV